MASFLASRTRWLGVAAILLAALVVAPGSAFATRTLGLSAGTFRFDLAAGQQASGQVVVTNDGTEPLKVMVYAADQTVDARGGITYATPTRADLQSLTLPSSWTTIKMPANSKALGNIPYLELNPKQRVPVRFSITVPPNVPPGDHNLIVFFESFEPPKPGQGAQSSISGRLGARVTLRVAGDLVRKLEIRPYSVPQYVIGGVVSFDFLLRNVGNIDQRIGARVLLLDRNDNEIQRKTVIDGITSFAQTNIETSGTLLADKMPVGEFKVRLDVSPVGDDGKATNGGADTLTETRTVWLIPYWLLVLIGVIVLAVVVRVVWTIAARSARRTQKRIDERAAQIVAAGEAKRPFPDHEHED
jgi:hypothetical protein